MKREPNPSEPARKDGIMQDISPDMRDFFGLLLKHQVRFALCGGFAVTYTVFDELHVADLWGMRIPVVSRRSLLRAKKETGRPKDKVDLAELKAIADQERNRRH